MDYEYEVTKATLPLWGDEEQTFITKRWIGGGAVTFHADPELPEYQQYLKDTDSGLKAAKPKAK